MINEENIIHDVGIVFTNKDIIDAIEEDINEIYHKEICISPLKSLSLHLTNINSSYGLAPFINYKELWEENKLDD